MNNQSKYNFQDFYQSVLTTYIPSDYNDGTFEVQSPPESTRFFIVVDADDRDKREIFYIYHREGNVLYYRGIDRTSPKQHTTNAVVKMNVMAYYHNDFDSKLGTLFNYERITGLDIKVFGGEAQFNRDFITITDLELTLEDDTTTYIYFDLDDKEIKSTTVRTDTGSHVLIHTIVTESGGISSSTRRSFQMIPYEKVDGIVTTDDTEAVADTIVVQDGTTGRKYKKSTYSIADLIPALGLTESFSCPNTNANDQFTITVTNDVRPNTMNIMSINGEVLSTDNIVSVVDKEITISVPYVVTVDDVFTITYSS